MELKFAPYKEKEERARRSNRTFMELKYNEFFTAEYLDKLF